jgi:LysM repeat protein
MDNEPDQNITDSVDENPHQRSNSISESPLLKAGSYLVAASLVLLAVYLLWRRINSGAIISQSMPDTSQVDALAPDPAISSADGISPELVPFVTPASLGSGITRITDLDTIIPGRPREDVISYTVQTGDNLFVIADRYGVKPETVLWGNYATLKDNPEIIRPEQVLNILPVDGTYYQWQQGDTLKGVATFFKANAEDIIDYPGNHIDLTTIVSGEPQIQPGTWIIIPGGKRELKDWGPPAISRSNPAVARYYGPGSCGEIYEGAVGTGSFVWPTTSHLISGYSFSAIHPAIDIGGALGNAVYAADSGVVVYAGWSNYGYGNLIVIDHGNGWQTAYAHLSAIGVSCGQSVSIGIMIGALGSTGNSTGPHLHFEMGINGVKVNPLDYVN